MKINEHLLLLRKISFRTKRFNNWRSLLSASRSFFWNWIEKWDNDPLRKWMRGKRKGSLPCSERYDQSAATHQLMKTNSEEIWQSLETDFSLIILYTFIVLCLFLFRIVRSHRMFILLSNHWNEFKGGISNCSFDFLVIAWLINSFVIDEHWSSDHCDLSVQAKRRRNGRSICFSCTEQQSTLGPRNYSWSGQYFDLPQQNVTRCGRIAQARRTESLFIE